MTIPDHKKRKAYHMRCSTRAYWKFIAKKCGFVDPSAALVAVKAYAKKHHLPAPPARPFTLGELAYEDYAAGADWWEIARDHQISSALMARSYARKWAYRWDHPWPIQRELANA
tara:strand:+ start:4170 stop:4511 length:342 start_codon:yes stop_codon:yes gene_type:complete